MGTIVLFSFECGQPAQSPFAFYNTSQRYLYCYIIVPRNVVQDFVAQS